MFDLIYRKRYSNNEIPKLQNNYFFDANLLTVADLKQKLYNSKVN